MGQRLRNHPAVVDVRSDVAVAACIEEHGLFDVLFNCAGFVHGGTILDSRSEEWNFALDLNLISMVRTIRVVLPGMLARGKGSIVTRSSVASRVKGALNRCVYGTTKAAVIGLTKSVAADFVSKGVRCNAACPGTVRTPSLDERIAAQGDVGKARAAFIARQPIGRIGTADEIAALDAQKLPLVPEPVRFGPCVANVGKSICIGLNYSDHAAESGMQVPREPVVFMKATSVIIGPNDDVETPRGAKKADWVVELGAVIGKHAKYVDEARAMEHFAGYCVISDLSEHELQLEGTGQWRIVPFRGEYYELETPARARCKNLIYPVPDPSFPFLGVHYTRSIHGGVECGPNAVLSLAREGYNWSRVRLGDLWDTLGYPAFLKFAKTHWRTGRMEIWRSLSKDAFTRSLQRLIPEIRREHLARAPAGVRAQALGPDGSLIDDFLIQRNERIVNLRNAPSPAATSSPSIGETIVDHLAEYFR